MGLTSILAVGQDPELLESRSAILRAAGCVTVQASSISDAIKQFMAGDFDLVLLCHSIPAPERLGLTGLIRATGSLTPIVTVVPLTGQVSAAFADTTIAADPEGFLRGIENACSRRATMYRMPGPISGFDSMRAAQADIAARSASGRVIEMTPPLDPAAAPDTLPDRDDPQIRPRKTAGRRGK
jgi:CheY-like chemotaxis protein